MPDHSIGITADGDVNGTDKILRSGNLYTFTGDIVGSIVVFRSGIVVDGAGYTLQGNGARTGIWLQGKSNVEIKNLHIRNFTHGIEFTYALSLEGCTNITLSGNTITDNEYGITSWLFSRSNVFLGNTIENNTYGVYINNSPNNTFRNNRLTNNKYNFWVTSETSVQMTHFINDIDESNTINGKPIVYWVNEHDKTVPSDTGYVALVNCTNITVRNQNISNNGQGILLVATNNSLITKNHLTTNNYGIVLYAPYEQCTSNVISGNNITANTKDGIRSWNSEYTIITGNIISDNQENGINFVSSSINAYIFGNTITRNIEYGIRLFFGSANNTIYHNNFIDNIKQGVASSSIPVRWDNGAEGNYWSDYTGTDSDGDGLGDTPYSNIYGVRDFYPFMAPLTIFDAGTWEGENYNVNVVSNSTVSDFIFDPEGARVRFSVDGETGTTGFCRMTLPQELLDAETDWIVLVDDNPVTHTVEADENSTYIYFTYGHSAKTVEIIGTETIPEFPSWIILPLLIAVTFVALLYKKRLFSAD